MENHEYIWIPQTTEIHLGESLAYTYVHKFLLCFSFVVWKFKSIYRKVCQTCLFWCCTASALLGCKNNQHFKGSLTLNSQPFPLELLEREFKKKGQCQCQIFGKVFVKTHYEAMCEQWRVRCEGLIVCKHVSQRINTLELTVFMSWIKIRVTSACLLCLHWNKDS